MQGHVYDRILKDQPTDDFSYKQKFAEAYDRDLTHKHGKGSINITFKETNPINVYQSFISQNQASTQSLTRSEKPTHKILKDYI